MLVFCPGMLFARRGESQTFSGWLLGSVRSSAEIASAPRDVVEPDAPALTKEVVRPAHAVNRRPVQAVQVSGLLWDALHSIAPDRPDASQWPGSTT